MRTVFLDTVGLLATWDASDQWHASARPVFETMLTQRVPVITSTFVAASSAGMLPPVVRIDSPSPGFASRWKRPGG